MLRRTNQPETAFGSETELRCLPWRIEVKMIILDESETMHCCCFVKGKLCCP